MISQCPMMLIFLCNIFSVLYLRYPPIHFIQFRVIGGVEAYRRCHRAKSGAQPLTIIDVYNQTFRQLLI